MTKAAASAWLTLLAGFLATGSAHADCAADLQALRARLTVVKDPHRREEIARLAEKADIDHRAGRERLCAEAVDRALRLVKPAS